ncbi:SDR family NAD(P)-dependent oxidoreductase [Brucella cytisi]|uniref:SDR family NAD(P)-dependent oxidoreductase n=1 Tax=Brucella cytisi TaxID=407152 RepID=UPI0035BC6C69
MSDFANRIALVTGAGSGIGRAAAVAYARAGARGVVLAGRQTRALEDTAELVTAQGAVSLVVPTDVSANADVENLLAKTLHKFDAIDACFNNAGTLGSFLPARDMTEADFDATISVNLKGVWLCCKHQMIAMRLGKGGSIVNTSSWLAHGAFPGSSAYSASKSALDGMIRALAQEGAADGIRLNNVNPGIIDTPMFRLAAADNDATRPFIHHTPAGRLGTPEDVADVAVWLSSDRARFVTGQNILIDGGYTIPGHRA